MTATALLILLVLLYAFSSWKRATAIRLQRMRAEADHKLQIIYSDSIKGYYGCVFQEADQPLRCVWENGEWKQIP